MNKKITPIVAIAPDSFKGALEAAGVAGAIAAGFRRGCPAVATRQIPMADGGEGTVAAWVAATKAELVEASVHDPLGRPIRAVYARDQKRHLAVIEMAAASGLPLLHPDQYNPLVTTTRGTGELIRHALDGGAQTLLLGIGGSATNDGGVGMATALGARFLDAMGNPLAPGGGALQALDRVDLTTLDPRLAKIKLQVACDVTNPLCGACGASAVYGPQKGATPEQIPQLEAGLAKLAQVITAQFPDLVKLEQTAGAGAAGGLGYGLMVFCSAELGRGVELVADAVQLEERLRGCSLVVTGEGRIDGQTVNGKTPVGVAAVARRLGIPTIAICGCLGEGYAAVHEAGIAAVFPVAHGHFDPENLACGARERIQACATETARLLALRFNFSA